MPDAEQPAQRPWLAGIVACATTVEAGAVRAALRERGLGTRSVPAGRAAAAWTCVAPEGTIALVVSGQGDARARDAAGYWMLRSRAVVVVAASPGTGRVQPPALVADGDEALLARLRTAHPQPAPPLTVASIATVTHATEQPLALQSLADAGIASTDTVSAVWRRAAHLVGGSGATLHAVAPIRPLPRRLRRLTRQDGAARSVWRTTVDILLHPKDRGMLRRADRAIRDATLPAARTALAALLPGAPQP